MIWILCTASFLAGGVVAIFLVSCSAIAQQSDEQSDRIYSLLARKKVAD